MTQAIRVLVADDSPTVRYHLTGMIKETPGLQVVGEARDGQEAVEMADALQPDVISMDIRMPRMDGFEATRQIMSRRPTPIVMVSALLEEDIDMSFKALEAGALALLPKPPARQDPNFDASQRQFTNTLLAMSGVSVVRRWSPDSDAAPNGLLHRTVELPQSSGRVERIGTGELKIKPELLAIGASAGGPSALADLLHGVPADFSLPIVIVQHMPDEFVSGLSRWLSNSSRLPVSIAREGQFIESGKVYIAPGGKHLRIGRNNDDDLIFQFVRRLGGYRYFPSVDVLLTSVAEVCGASGIGVILTGMGDDGAAGLLALRQSGGRTFAQDEASCTVFGMPAAAVERGGAEQVLSPPEIIEAVLRLI